MSNCVICKKNATTVYSSLKDKVHGYKCEKCYFKKEPKMNHFLCGYCNKIYSKSGKANKYCSKTCRMKYGKFVQKTFSTEEMKERLLASGRKSYRKNIESRLFYYRELAQKRRGITGNFSKDGWNNLLDRQKNICAICQIKMEKPTIDHVVPVSKWKEWASINNPSYSCNDIDNIQALCGSCNSRKKDKLLT